MDQNGWFIKEHPIKVDDLEIFGGTPIYGNQQMYLVVVPRVATDTTSGERFCAGLSSRSCRSIDKNYVMSGKARRDSIIFATKRLQIHDEESRSP